MHHQEIKEKFLGHYVLRGHLLLPDTSLVPADYDPSGLFINSGMHTIKPYFYGIEKPDNPKLCSSQKCVRTIDIDDVGLNRRTLTFFNMLGNWSINDYWKDENIPWAYDLLVNVLGFEKGRLWATYFSGNDSIPVDTETRDKWLNIGVPEERILGLGEKDNFWGAGPTGLCGPCTEVYYDRGDEYGCGNSECSPGCDCDRFLEIFNAGVHIQYERREDGSLIPLKLRSIDTGAGLERLATILQGKDSVFDASTHYPIVQDIIGVGQVQDGSVSDTRYVKILADHLKAISYLLAENVLPSNTDRGYVVRRLIRRSINCASSLGISNEGIMHVLDTSISLAGEDHPYVLDSKDLIRERFSTEYTKFSKTIHRARGRLFKELDKLPEGTARLDPSVAFQMFDTYGLPFEITRQICAERGIDISEQGFEALLTKHKEVSRKGAGEKFKSGLVSTTDINTRYHTATHLLHQALRDVLGSHVEQKGSNITEERMRFDFSHPKKVTPSEISCIEQIVNDKVADGLEVTSENMDLQQAIELGVIALFKERYDEDEPVTVFSIGDYSKEVCTGPHVTNTIEIGKFKVIKEQSSSAGVRRIKARIE